MSEYQVIKANELIQKSRFNLSTQQQKIVLFLISKIKPTDEDFKTYEFSISDFCQVCGIESKGENYPAIRKAIKDIADKSMWLELPDNGNQEALVRWIEKPIFRRNNGTISLQLNEHLKPYLLQLKKNFTQYQLLWTLQFRSKYSIRLYELINSYVNLIGEKTFELEEIKKLLGAENHKTYFNFYNRALAPALKEINDESNIWVEIETIKTGRAITHITFYFEEQPYQFIFDKKEKIKTQYGLNQLTIAEF